MSGLSPGQIIALADGRHAVVKFVGNTHFAPGEWVGVELEDATGKNDGAVQGERYFDCKMGFGMFLRPAAIAEFVDPDPAPTKPKVNGNATNGSAVKPRPSMGVNGGGGVAGKRQSVGPTALKRQSLASASPTPASRPPGGRPSLRVCKALDVEGYLEASNVYLVPYKITYETACLYNILGSLYAPNEHALYPNTKDVCCGPQIEAGCWKLDIYGASSSSQLENNTTIISWSAEQNVQAKQCFFTGSAIESTS